MTVHDLITYLTELDGNLEIIIGADDEGNDFDTPYRPHESWCVEDDTRCGFRPVADQDVDDGEYDIDDLTKMVVM